MSHTKKETLQAARALMDDFARRTGLIGKEGDARQRYLWTDAFAVQTFFGLARAAKEDSYRQLALLLIDRVHNTLGRFHPDDDRQGWISGLGEEEGKKHPTAGGLRIGKKMLERKADEPFNERLEWERDGQYFHYLTRWINALLQASAETKEKKYAHWAAELSATAEKFIDQDHMYWKMSIELSRPLVLSMGAHDPLEGLICTLSAIEAAPQFAKTLQPVVKKFEALCSGRDWSTTDPLGIGGLLLNAVRAADLTTLGKKLPGAVLPEKLFADSLNGLNHYIRMFNPKQTAGQRLAFRECGLSLGLRVLFGLKEWLSEKKLYFEAFETFKPLVAQIEKFWLTEDNQTTYTWSEHMDINSVSLAASLVAWEQPSVFCAFKNK